MPANRMGHVTFASDSLACAPINRGSLLRSIENLLKTIETSENAVMIPTLMRDKVQVDAWELLFVAKILKASILGHGDLVEFYMNHIGHSLIDQQKSAEKQSQQQQQQQTAPTTPNGNGSLSPSSPVRTTGGALVEQQNGSLKSNSLSLSSASSISSDNSSNNSLTTTTIGQQQEVAAHANGNSGGTAESNGRQAAGAEPTDCSNSSLRDSSSSSASSSSSSSSSSSASSSSTAATYELEQSPPRNGRLSLRLETTVENSTTSGPAEQAASPPATKPILARQAQPPSLLQLTTTNNHINSVAANFQSFNGSGMTTNIEQLSQQLAGLQSPTSAIQAEGGSPLSVATSPQQQRPELRTSRSAGCLFRANSGASSPRTPTTPFPQAETMAANNQGNGLIGDPSAPVKLLLQIEQLKSSISHVTTLLESVVELYKKSIDNIA